MPETSIIMQGTISVGYILVRIIGDTYRLGHLVVAEELRGKGIGTATLKLVKKLARKRGLKRWGLHCDVTHEIPYKMYIKVGMTPKGQGFYLQVPTGSITSLAPVPQDLSLTVVVDAASWPELEIICGIFPGEIAGWAKMGSIPLALFDIDRHVQAFAIYDPTSGFICSLYFQDPETLQVFMKLLYGYIQSVQSMHADDTLLRLWIPNKNSRQTSELIVKTIPGATAAEEYDYLEGSTME